jgi:hypothetical protein
MNSEVLNNLAPAIMAVVVSVLGILAARYTTRHTRRRPSNKPK